MSVENISHVLYIVSIWVVPALIAITFHEAAHGYLAWRLGDDTAFRMGRVTFNPLKHIDGFGTIALPALLLLVRAPFIFGWAKPVPVNFARLRNPRRDMVLVAAAGPATNLALAIASAWLLHVSFLLPEPVAAWTAYTLGASVLINVIIAVFNMLPLPPLDGGKVAVGLLPRPLGTRLARLEKWGFLIILGLLFLLPFVGSRLGVDLHIFFWLVGVPSFLIINGIAVIVGVNVDLMHQLIAFVLGLG
ncbi:MAG: site-2 protease family protein [Alphaproteobacteria bacterium]